MSTAFDTLRIAEELEAGGFTHEQATSAAKALARAVSAAELATKSDLLATRNDLRNEIQAVKTELHNEIQGVKTELRNEIQGVRTELEHKIELMGSNLLYRLSALVILAVTAATGIILGVLPLLLR